MIFEFLDFWLVSIWILVSIRIKSMKEKQTWAYITKRLKESKLIKENEIWKK